MKTLLCHLWYFKYQNTLLFTQHGILATSDWSKWTDVAWFEWSWFQLYFVMFWIVHGTCVVPSDPPKHDIHRKSLRCIASCPLVTVRWFNTMFTNINELFMELNAPLISDLIYLEPVSEVLGRKSTKSVFSIVHQTWVGNLRPRVKSGI